MYNCTVPVHHTNKSKQYFTPSVLFVAKIGQRYTLYALNWHLFLSFL